MPQQKFSVQYSLCQVGVCVGVEYMPVSQQDNSASLFSDQCLSLAMTGIIAVASMLSLPR